MTNGATRLLGGCGGVEVAATRGAAKGQVELVLHQIHGAQRYAQERETLLFRRGARVANPGSWLEAGDAGWRLAGLVPNPCLANVEPDGRVSVQVVNVGHRRHGHAEVAPVHRHHLNIKCLRKEGTKASERPMR